jgi:hypothetical protein
MHFGDMKIKANYSISLVMLLTKLHDNNFFLRIIGTLQYIVCKTFIKIECQRKREIM